MTPSDIVEALPRMQEDAAWKFTPLIANLRASEIRELLKLIDDPDVISFAGGIPAPEMFPLAATAEVFSEMFDDVPAAQKALQYSISEGLRPLREWIARHMSREGIAASPDEILITNGSQQGLDFIGRALVSPGQMIAVPRPCYLGALQVLGTRTDDLRDMPADAEGPTPAGLNKVLEAGARLLYLNPDFANPSGETISRRRRLEIIKALHAHDTILVEDSPYRELRYEGTPIESFAALEAGLGLARRRVVQLGSFSKILSPGLRIGWLYGPSLLVDKLVLMKQAADLHTPTITQMAILSLASRTFAMQVERLRVTYRARRDAMLAALEDFAPEGLTWSRPEGGMFIWLRLPADTDSRELLERSLKAVRVAFVPGAAFYATQPLQNMVRLSFSTVTPAEIRKGIELLMSLF